MHFTHASCTAYGNARQHIQVHIPLRYAYIIQTTCPLPTQTMQGAVSGTPKLTSVQAALWVNQPGVAQIGASLTREERMRQECIHETIATERSYVRDLERTLALFHRCEKCSRGTIYSVLSY